MACIEVHIKKVSSDVITSAKKAGSLYANSSLIADNVTASFGRSEPALAAQAEIVQWKSTVGFGKVGSLYAWSSMVCAPGIGPEPVIPDEKYLEIEPKILWVFEDLEMFNSVFSNVTWRVL